MWNDTFIENKIHFYTNHKKYINTECQNNNSNNQYYLYNIHMLLFILTVLKFNEIMENFYKIIFPNRVTQCKNLYKNCMVKSKYDTTEFHGENVINGIIEL